MVSLYLFPAEMIVPDVDKNILEELEGMGFPKARATRALHYSGKNLAFFHYWLWAPFIIFGKLCFTFLVSFKNDLKRKMVICLKAPKFNSTVLNGYKLIYLVLCFSVSLFVT